MANLKVILTDAAGRPLRDHVVIDLYPSQSSQSLQASADLVGSLQIKNIDISSGPVYRVVVTPANHRVTQQFVTLSEERPAEYQAAVPVDPAKVNNIDAPAFAGLPLQTQHLLAQAAVPRFHDGAGGFLQGPNMYSALDTLPLLKACLLNITAKAAAIPMPASKSVLDYFQSVVRMEQDRMFLRTSAALLEEVSHCNAFHAVPAALHDPLPGFRLGASFKTFDPYGNLQLTFQRRMEADLDYVVDVDIDDAQGIGHIFQVLHNSVAGPTHPYDIHEILLRQQPPVVPGYDFVFASRMAVG